MYSRYKNITEPDDDDINDLHEKLVDAFGSSAKLEKYIDYIIGKKTTVYFYSDKPEEKFHFSEIKSAAVKFTVFTSANNLKEIKFNARLIFKTTENESYEINDNLGKISGIEHLAFIIRDKRKIIYIENKDKPSGYVNLISEILSPNLVFNAADINLLKEHVEKNNLNDYVRIDFNKTAIKLKKIIPKPVLEIEKNENSTSVKLLFEYERTALTYDKSYSAYVFTPDETDDDLIEIYQKNNKFEKDVFEYIVENLQDALSPFNNSDYSSSDINLKVNLETKDFLIRYGIKFMEQGYELKFKNKEKIKRYPGNVRIKVKSGIDWFDIEAVIVDQGSEKKISFNPEELKSGLVKINSGYVVLSKKDILKLEKFAAAGMNNDATLKLNKLHFNAIDLLNDELPINENESNKTSEIIERIKNFKKIQNQKIPKNFRGTLRDYQSAGFNWLCFLYEYNLNGCLADDMGLGKTVQTLCLLQKLKDENKLDKVLLIVPVSTIANWESEISRFTPDLKSLRHIGGNRIKENETFRNIDIIITSYHTFRNDVEFFKSINFTYVILDEAQNIKNSGSQTFKSVKLINAEHKLSLTGTPVENSSLELWSQMDFLHSGLLGQVQKFKIDFALQIEKHNNSESSKRLKQIVNPFILRRKKEDVAKDLPDKEEIIFYCEMDTKQKDFYESIKKQYYIKVSNEIDAKGLEKSSMIFFEGILRLRQAALFPGIIDVEYEILPSCKNEALFDIIDDIIIEDHKALIFSQFVETLKRIEKEVKIKNCGYAYLDGSTRDRDREINKFQQDKNTKLFLLSIKAGGTGINLTSADYVVLFDPWWNPSVEKQAVDRAHRIGQKNKVIVYKLIVKDSIEEKILILQDKKKKLVSDLITEESGLFKSLTREDILDLFK